MSTKRARLDGPMDFPDQADIRNLTTSLTLDSANKASTSAVNTANGEIVFNLPAEFSVYRNKSCSIQVISSSLLYNTDAALYTDEPASSIVLATNIQVQGLSLSDTALNNPSSVQAQLKIEDLTKTYNALGVTPGRQIFYQELESGTFRCQSLPDKITLFMLRATDTTVKKIAPNHASMTLQIDFDEPL
tara:strand:- start:82 stop:648 length:567 start_codon:yes stop_codon:yes gene_type:complete